MLDIPTELRDLQRLAPHHQALVTASTAAAGLSAWRAYFPYLCGQARGGSRTLLMEVDDGAVCLYLLRPRDERLRLDLYLAPFPFSAAALKRAQSRVETYNGSRSCEVVWVEEGQRRTLEALGFRTRHREDEYLYDASQVRALAGPSFQRLRRNLGKADRLADLQVRPYRAEDEAACLGLLRDWRRSLLTDKGVDVRSHAYMTRCVRQAHAYQGGLLRGEVATLADRVVGLCFGGPMRPGLGNLFVTVTDRDVPLLGYALRHGFLARNADLEQVNDGSDTGREGVAFVKRAFNPVAMLSLYRATSGPAGDAAEAHGSSS